MRCCVKRGGRQRYGLRNAVALPAGVHAFRGPLPPVGRSHPLLPKLWRPPRIFIAHRRVGIESTNRGNFFIPGLFPGTAPVRFTNRNLQIRSLSLYPADLPQGGLSIPFTAKMSPSPALTITAATWRILGNRLHHLQRSAQTPRAFCRKRRGKVSQDR